MSSLLKKLHQLYSKYKYILLQTNDENGTSYIWKQNHSDEIIIVFSGIGQASYNYVKSLKKSKCDQLYIKDCWANGVSYYWYEHKEDYPEIYTQALIERILKKGQYKKVYTVGSSKGGSAALYYGFKNEVDLIYVGACQYLIGNYLAKHQIKQHPEQWENMVGNEVLPEWINKLNKKLPDIIEEHRTAHTKVHLLYSTEEHTYTDDIVHLLEKLDSCKISHKDQIEKFTNHSMIGYYFKIAIQKFFTK